MPIVFTFRIIQYSYTIIAGGRYNVSKINSWGTANGAGISISKSKISFTFRDIKIGLSI